MSGTQLALYSVDTALKRPPREFDLSPLHDVTVENGSGYTFISHIHVLHADNFIFHVVFVVVVVVVVVGIVIVVIIIIIIIIIIIFIV